MILVAELMIFEFLGTLAVHGVDFRENHACQNRRQTAMISFAELIKFMVLDILAAQGVDFRENHACQNGWCRWGHENHVKYVCWGRSGHSSGVAERTKTT